MKKNIMKWIAIFSALLLVFTSFSPTLLAVDDDEIAFSDFIEDEVVRNKLSHDFNVEPDQKFNKKYLDNIGTLILTEDFTTLKGVEQLPQLKRLMLFGTNFSDASELKDFPSLSQITIQDNTAIITGMKELTNVLALEITGNYEGNIIEVPQGLKFLTLTNMQGKKVESITPSLQSIILKNMVDFDFSSLRTFTELQRFDADQLTNIDDTSFVENLLNLNEIIFDAANTSILTYEMPSLKTVKITGEFEKFSYLKKNPTIEVLNLEDSKISNYNEMNELVQLPNLKNINIVNIGLTDESQIISTLAEHPSLVTIDLTSNYLSDFSDLSRLNLKDNIDFSAYNQSVSVTAPRLNGSITLPLHVIIPENLVTEYPTASENLSVYPNNGGVFNENNRTITWDNVSSLDEVSYQVSFAASRDNPGSHASYRIGANVNVTLTDDPVAKHKVTYDANGGQGAVPTQADVAEGEAVVVKFAPLPTLDGKVFAGWNDGVTTYQASPTGDDVTFTMPTTDVVLKAVWENAPIPKHKVTYDANGGQGSVPTQADVAEGVAVVVQFSPLPTLDGKIFAGWNDGVTTYQASPTGDDVTFTMPTNDVVLKAVWENAPIPKHKVTYDANGGQGSVPTQADVAEGEAVVVKFAPLPTLDGKIFAGWNDGVTTYQASPTGDDVTFTMPTNDVVLKAVWENAPIPKHKVTYDANGGQGSVPTQADVAEGEAVVVQFSPQPTLDGKVFAGWNDGVTTYKASPTGDDVTFTMPTTDVVLKAVWENAPIPKHKVTYDANGGQGSVPTQADVAEGEAVVVQFSPLPTLDGKVFAGWNDGVTTYQASLTGDDVTFTMPTNDVVLKAVWENAPIPKHKVTYDANGGQGAVPTQADVAEGEAVVVKFAPLPTLDGKIFAGWNDGTTTYKASPTGDDVTFTMPTNDVVLKAVWENAPIPKHKVTYDANGGQGAVPTQADVAEGEAVVVQFSPLPTLDGKVFAGWNDGVTTYQASPTGDDVTFTMPTTDVVLKAVWENAPIPKHKVTYDANGGQGAVPTQADVAEGEAVVVKFAPLPTLDGKVFAGWNDGATTYQASPTGDDVTFIMPTTDVVLKAVWENAPIPKHKVTYDANGGQGSVPTQADVAEGEAVVVQFSPLPTLDGKVFAGWNDGTTTYKASPTGDDVTFTMPTNDVVLKAVWENAPIPKHKVTYDANGGQGAVPTQADVAEGEAVVVQFSPLPTLDGKVFAGWNDGVTTYKASPTGDDVTFTMPTNDVVLKAVWENAPIPKHKVTYDANGGQGSVPTQADVAEGEAVVVQFSPLPTLDGKVFAGWNDGVTTYQASPTGDDVTFTMPTNDVVLKAVWDEDTITFKYRLMYTSTEHTSGTVPVDSNLYLYEDSATILSSNLKRDGYELKGWKYNGKIYHAGDIVKISKLLEEALRIMPFADQVQVIDVNLTAEWEKIATPPITPPTKPDEKLPTTGEKQWLITGTFTLISSALLTVIVKLRRK